eukprot:1150001-Pelagomonas_calceolata.AAC.2
MEGAAQGGMILCEQDFAEKAAEAWASAQPPELDLPNSLSHHVIEDEMFSPRTSRPWEVLQNHPPTCTVECMSKTCHDV